MKKLITICLLIATSFTINAQELSFEETVQYIKTKMVEKSRYSYKANTYSTIMTYDVQITKDGKITIIYGTESSYPDLKFNIQNLLKIVLDETYTEFIRFYTSNSSFYLIETDSQIESEKLVKAFNHLKTLCTKEKDPFQN